MPEALTPAQPKPFRRNFRNWLSWSGLVLAASALFAFFLLFAIDLFARHSNPYIGILAYLVAPLFFALGILLVFLGAFIRSRTRRRAVEAAAPLAIKIDFSRPRDRRILALFAVGSVAFLFITALGSYETYQYTESVQFCGKQCHLPMHPEMIASEHTAHARVECVACHVGPGAAAYFRSKVNGVKQLYHTVKNDFAQPIRITAEQRPSQAICEQCHWPNRYVGNLARTYRHFLSDEKNTPFGVRLLLNVGGADPTNGPVGGIHWHMNVSKKIEYIATDELRMNIPWVRMTDRDGVVTVFKTADFSDDPNKHEIHRMDCMDCHSRPAHKVHTPNDAVDLALATGQLDRKVPWLKARVVAALVKPYKTKAEGLRKIANQLGKDYPNPAQSAPIIRQTQRIYELNFFPEVKVDWRTHPDFVGHKNWNGCFRCHDGNHVTSDGKLSIKASDCKSCHLILAQGSDIALDKISAAGENFIHIDSEYSDFTCADCHNGGPQKE